MAMLLGRGAVLLGVEQALKHGLPLAVAQWNADAANDPRGSQGGADLILPNITADDIEIHPEALPKIKDLTGDSDALCRVTSAPGGSFLRHGAHGGDRTSNVVVSLAIRHRSTQGPRSSQAVLEIFANVLADVVAAALDGVADESGAVICLGSLPYGIHHWEDVGIQVDFLTVQDTTSEPTGLLVRIQYQITHTSAH